MAVQLGVTGMRVCGEWFASTAGPVVVLVGVRVNEGPGEGVGWGRMHAWSVGFEWSRRTRPCSRALAAGGWWRMLVARMDYGEG